MPDTQTARDAFLQRLGAALMDRDNPNALKDACDEYEATLRAEHFEEAAAVLQSDVSLQGPYLDVLWARAAQLLRRVGKTPTTSAN